MASATATTAPSVTEPDRFSFTLFIAVSLHGILLFGVGFSLPEEKPPAKSLEITLAQYISDKVPDDADFLAQANQEGSGDLEEKQQLSTTHLADFSDNIIQDVQKIKQNLTQFNVSKPAPTLLSSLQDAIQQASDPEKKEDVDSTAKDETILLDQRSMEIASLEAQLRAKKQIYAKAPLKRQLTAASAKQSRDALYLYNWRKRIEAVGNGNYPHQLELYGDLRLLVAIQADGTVKEVRILKSTGHKQLDDAALKIVRLAAPFDPFPPEIRKDTDILEIIRTWRFHIGNTLSSD